MKPDPVIVTSVPPVGGPEVGDIEVTTLGAFAVNASPLVSTAAQKLADAQETDVRFGFWSPGTWVLLQLPPLHESAYPWLSTATQNVELGQETEVGAPKSPESCWPVPASALHEVPFQVRNSALASTAMQKLADAQETDARPPSPWL